LEALEQEDIRKKEEGKLETESFDASKDEKNYNIFSPLIERLKSFFTSPITKPSWLVYTGFVICIALTVFLMSYTSYYHFMRVRGDFNNDAAHLRSIFHERVARYTNVLQATASLVSSHHNVLDVNHWRLYVSSLLSPELFPGFWGVNYIENVEEANLERFKKQLSQDAARELPVFPASYMSSFYVIKYVYANVADASYMKDFRKALGFNVASNDVARNALEIARDTGKPTATAPLYLVIDPAKQHLSFVVYYPIYQTEDIPKDLKERRKLIKGWISAPINAKYFLQDLATDSVRLEVKDGTWTFLSFDSSIAQHGHISQKGNYTVWGRTWSVEMRATGSTTEPFYNISYILIPILGFLLSAAVAFVLWSLTTTRRRAQALAKKMSDDLRVSEMKNRAILENVPGAMFRCSAHINWQMEFVSDAIELITGYEAILFTTQQKAYSDILFEMDIPLVEKTIGLSSRPGHSYDLEYRIRHKDHSLRWISERGRVIVDPGTSLPHLMGTLFDVTERKRREADVRSLTTALQNAVEGILFVDRDFTCRTVNESYAALFDKLPGAFIHTSWLRTFIQEDQERIISLCRNAAPYDRITLDVRALQDSGDSLHLYLVMVSAVDDEGEVEGYYCFVRDMTQRIKEEEALAIAVEEAKRANKTKSEFLATMSHELRTPLNAIIGYSEMLIEEVEDLEDKSIEEDLKKINGAGRHLLELINDILDVSKLEAGKTTYYFEKFDIKQMVKGIGDLMLPAASKNSNKFIVDCPADIGEMYSDYTKVRQGLFNLASNAVKFTNEGTVTLRVGPIIHDKREFLAFSVQDTGCGITPEQLENLFQPFVQADSSTTRQYGGTGLGLTITKRFCEALGGSVEVESQKDVGSTFTLLLPRITSNTVVETLSRKDNQDSKTDVIPKIA
jgi:PAS domain S-box-containing protein